MKILSAQTVPKDYYMLFGFSSSNFDIPSGPLANCEVTGWQSQSNTPVCQQQTHNNMKHIKVSGIFEEDQTTLTEFFVEIGPVTLPKVTSQENNFFVTSRFYDKDGISRSELKKLEFKIVPNIFHFNLEYSIANVDDEYDSFHYFPFEGDKGYVVLIHVSGKLQRIQAHRMNSQGFISATNYERQYYTTSSSARLNHVIGCGRPDAAEYNFGYQYQINIYNKLKFSGLSFFFGMNHVGSTCTALNDDYWLFLTLIVDDSTSFNSPAIAYSRGRGTSYSQDIVQVNKKYNADITDFKAGTFESGKIIVTWVYNQDKVIVSEPFGIFFQIGSPVCTSPECQADGTINWLSDDQQFQTELKKLETSIYQNQAYLIFENSAGNIGLGIINDSGQTVTYIQELTNVLTGEIVSGDEPYILAQKEGIIISYLNKDTNNVDILILSIEDGQQQISFKKSILSDSYVTGGIKHPKTYMVQGNLGGIMFIDNDKSLKILNMEIFECQGQCAGECLQDFKHCSKCTGSDDAGLEVQRISNQGCICPIGYYDQYLVNSQCLVCHRTCDTCGSGTQKCDTYKTLPHSFVIDGVDECYGASIYTKEVDDEIHEYMAITCGDFVKTFDLLTGVITHSHPFTQQKDIFYRSETEIIVVSEGKFKYWVLEETTPTEEDITNYFNTNVYQQLYDDKNDRIGDIIMMGQKDGGFYYYYINESEFSAQFKLEDDEIVDISQITGSQEIAVLDTYGRIQIHGYTHSEYTYFDRGTYIPTGNLNAKKIIHIEGTQFLLVGLESSFKVFKFERDDAQFNISEHFTIDYNKMEDLEFEISQATMILHSLKHHSGRMFLAQFEFNGKFNILLIDMQVMRSDLIDEFNKGSGNFRVIENKFSEHQVDKIVIFDQISEKNYIYAVVKNTVHILPSCHYSCGDCDVINGLFGKCTSCKAEAKYQTQSGSTTESLARYQDIISKQCLCSICCTHHDLLSQDCFKNADIDDYNCCEGTSCGQFSNVHDTLCNAAHGRCLPDHIDSLDECKEVDQCNNIAQQINNLNFIEQSSIDNRGTGDDKVSYVKIKVDYVDVNIENCFVQKITVGNYVLQNSEFTFTNDVLEYEHDYFKMIEQGCTILPDDNGLQKVQCQHTIEFFYNSVKLREHKFYTKLRFEMVTNGDLSKSPSVLDTQTESQDFVDCCENPWEIESELVICNSSNDECGSITQENFNRSEDIYLQMKLVSEKYKNYRLVLLKAAYMHITNPLTEVTDNSVNGQVNFKMKPLFSGDVTIQAISKLILNEENEGGRRELVVEKNYQLMNGVAVSVTDAFSVNRGGQNYLYVKIISSVVVVVGMILGVFIVRYKLKKKKQRQQKRQQEIEEQEAQKKELEHWQNYISETTSTEQSLKTVENQNIQDTTINNVSEFDISNNKTTSDFISSVNLKENDKPQQDQEMDIVDADDINC